MALDANILAGLMSSKIEDIAYQYREAEKSPNDAHFAMASAIVDHIDQASDAVSEDDLNDRLDPIIGDIGDINNSVDELRDDIKSNFDDILATRDRLDGEFKPQLNLEVLNRKETDKELFKTTSSLANLRQRTAEFEDNITNAVFEVDPDNGTFNLRAYSYTDNAFTQAGLLIDGVEGQVTIQAGRITDLGNAVQDANASIDVLAGEIELRATYTEMTEFVSGALDAIIPAYSFGFFNSSEGWSAVNGALTQGNGFISCTIGDIENRNLSYSADDNPIITIVTTRTQGTGFAGDLIVYYESDIPRIYSGVLTQKEIDSQNVQNLNLSEEPTYTGVVTGIQLVLGETVDDIFEVDNITIGKPSAQLEALEGITAKVNKLGIDIDAIEGEITTFVTTTFYEENTITLNNVTQVLDGEEAIISLKATQTELNDQGTVDKANTAAIWVDGADANIRTSVVSFNAEEGGIDDQIAGITGSLDVINQELSTIDGARIRSNLLSINKLQIESGNLEEAQFYTELKLLDQRNNDLKIGDSVAIVDTQVKTLATDQSATAQEILELKASTGTIEGQVNANSTRIQQAETNISGNASAIAGLTTQVQNTQNDLSQAELLLDSTIDDLGVVSSRAYLGVSDVVGGKSEITGVTFNSQDNGIRFKGDIFELANTNGQTALYYDSSTNKWKFDGSLVIGGNSINTTNDLLKVTDHNLIRTEGQWSVDTSGSQGIFTQNGSSDENKVEVLTGPSGTPELVWNTFKGNILADGGWDVNGINIDPTRSYRNSVWMKQVGGFAESLYLGCSRGNTKNLSGVVNGNPYHWSGDLPVLNKWYLVVGIIHGNGYTGVDTDVSGVYDPETGKRVSAGVDFKNATASAQSQRVYRFYAVNQTHTAQFARPRFEEMDGNEPSLATLIGRIPLDGNDGNDGQVGAGFYGSTYTSISWTTSTASSRFTSLVGRSPVNGDIFTQTRTDGADSQARQYNGSSWVAVALQVNGSIVASGTIAGDKLIAGTEISAPRIVGGEIITDTGTGTRGEYWDDGTYLQWIGSGAKTDSNGIFWIKKDGTGFIKGDFFQGEIIATVTASASNINNNLTAITQSYTSAGKTAVINFNAGCSMYKDELNSQQNMTLTVDLYRGNTLIDTVSTMANKFFEPPETGIHNGRTYFTAGVSELYIDDATSVGTSSYKIVTTYSGLTTPFIVTRNTVSLTAQEDKLS